VGGCGGTEIPSLSRFDEALADPAYCVCSELPAQCGVVCVRVSCRQTPGLPGHAWAYLLVRLGGLHRRHPGELATKVGYFGVKSKSTIDYKLPRGQMCTKPAKVGRLASTLLKYVGSRRNEDPPPPSPLLGLSAALKWGLSWQMGLSPPRASGGQIS